VNVKGCPQYEPFGWEQWPDFKWMSYQFRRALGETQEGGGAVSECLMAASRMIPGDRESWYNEWRTIAERNELKGDTEEKNGHIRTSINSWLKAVDYYRSAEFWLDSNDPRRLDAFTRCEECFRKAGRYFEPPVEQIEIPYLDGTVLHSYFLRTPVAVGKSPVLIAFGGLDSFKEELYFMVARGALLRGISCLLVDGPGQGATLRREHIHSRYDYEIPVGKCIDYLMTRDDVDTQRIAVSGSSLGGYYAARAGSMESRVKATISHGAIWNVYDLWKNVGEDYALAGHIKWVFGTASVAEALELGKKFTLEGVLDHMSGAYLIVQGGHDFISVDQAKKTYDYARSKNVNVSLRIVTEEETGAEHCQHDNPTVGEDYMFDWLADVFGIKQTAGRLNSP